MAKTQLIRKSFNAGELSPELHYRDDLAAYVKGCKHLTNMVPTPYGAVTRRPPFEVLSGIDSDMYGIPIKYIPFKFSLDEVFHFVFTDGSGTAGVNPATADLIIFDSDGNIVVLDGTVEALSTLPAILPDFLSTGVTRLADTIYDPLDIEDIHFINVNDYVYLTCGGNYPVQRINRFFDVDDQVNRWKIEDAPFRGGPFLDDNTNTGDTLSVAVAQYNIGTTYAAGDVVFGITAGLSLDFAQFYDIGGGVHRLALFAPSDTSLGIGDKFILNGISLTGGSNCFFRGTDTPALGSLDGEWTKTATFTGAIWYTDIYIDKRSGGTIPSFTYSSPRYWAIEDYGSLYASRQDGNTGRTLSNTTWWEERDRFLGDVTITSNSDRFLATDVGRFISLATDNIKGTSGDFTFNQSSFPIIAGSLVELTTSGGAWGGKLLLQESTDGGFTWEDIGSIESSDGSYNGSIERNIAEPSSLVRVKMTDYVNPTTNYSKKSCSWQLKTPNGVSEIYEITAFTDSRTVTAMPITPIDRSRTDYRWSLGAFSDTSGYPFSITVHDERLVLGGCKTKPNTVYASRVNEWDNFLTGFQETSPYEFTVASDTFDTIRSLRSSRQLNVLTDNQEVTMGSRDDNAITSVTNIAVSSHTNYGSNNTQAIQMADMIWFVMGQGRRVRASKYDFASDGQQSVEMSLFASHITESGIKEMSFRRHPFNSLFCLLENGTGAVLTYEGMQEVKAWATIKTDGSIISASSNYSDTGDIIAGVVKRGNSYFLEKFGSITDSTVFLDNQTTWVDADFNAGQPIEQYDDGNLVVILNDAELVRDVDYTIAGGVLTIPSQLTGDVCIGRRIECRVNPTDISEVAPSGMVKRLTELGMYLLDSGTCTVKINGKESPFTDGIKWVAGQRESGLFELTTGGDYEQGLDVDITIDGHRHFTLTGLGYRLGISQG